MAYFNVSSGERRGIIFLCVVVLLATLVVWLVPRKKNEPANRNAASERRVPTNQRPYELSERRVETFAFDPNTADSTTLLRLGLTPAMLRGIYKFRGMGYTYSEPEDFSRVPGMTNEMWDRLGPYIHIDPRFQKVRRQSRATAESAVSASSAAEYGASPRFTTKLRRGETVELNSSDTATLKRIPGIGPYYARKIVGYRRQLGGFASLSQLAEIEGLPEGVTDYLTLDEAAVRRIDVNHATKRALLVHPYIGVYRAQPIWEYRHNHGSLKSLDDLRKLQGFTDEDIERLAPYLEFR